MMRQKTVKIIFIVICLGIFIGSGYGYYIKRQTVVLEFGMFVGSNWDVANPNSYVIIDKAIKRFESEHKDVSIHYYSGILKEDYSEWLSRQILMGKTPDVFMILTNDFNQLASLGVLKDLSYFQAKDQSFDLNHYYTTALNTGKYNGQQYALPYETVPTLMFVNKTLLTKEGIDLPENNWTWEDLYDISQKVTKDLDQDGVLDQFGSYNYSWLEAVYTNGCTVFAHNGEKAYFTDAGVVDSIKFLKKLYDLNQGQIVTQDDYDSGKVAFMPLLFSDYRVYKTYPYKIKKYSDFKWDCITLPAGVAGENVSEVNTLLMGISGKTKKEKLAEEFLKLLTYDEAVQMDIFRYSKGVSVLKNVTGSKEAEMILREDMDESENIIDNKLLSDVIEQGTITPKFQKYNEVIKLADSEADKIIEESKNIDNSLKILQRMINHYLKQ